MIDSYGGSVLAPVDWTHAEPTIQNTQPGVDQYYLNKFGRKSEGFFYILRNAVFGKSADEGGVDKKSLSSEREEKEKSELETMSIASSSGEPN